MRAAITKAALLLPLVFAPARSETGPQFDIWTVENGLPQNSVTSILQASNGYLWLTTFDGLVRFDGVNFTVFNTANSPGMQTNRLVLLFEDRGGTMWIVTENAGLTSMRGGKFRTYTTADGLPGNNPLRLRDLDDGSVLVETGQRGLARIRDGKVYPYDATGKFADFGYPVTPTVVWHRDAGGLHRVMNGRSMEDVPLTGLPPGELWGLYEDSRRDLWCWVEPNRNRVWRWHAGIWKSYTMESRGRIFGEDPSGTVWIGTIEGNLARLEDERVVTRPCAVERLTPVTECASSILAECDRGTSRQHLIQKVTDWGFPQEIVERELLVLQNRGFVVAIDERLISLVHDDPITPLPDANEFPGGYLDE